MLQLCTLAKNLIQTQDVDMALVKTGGIFCKTSQILYSKDENKICFDNVSIETDTRAYSQFLEIAKIQLEIETLDIVPYKSGSIAQIFRGSLKDGRQVVFKLIHSNIQQTLQEQCALLRQGFAMAKWLGFQLSHIDQECTDLLMQETNLYKEAGFQIKLKESWSLHPRILIPLVYPDLSTSTVMCSEFIDACPLQEFINTASQEDINEVALTIATFIFHNHLKYDIFYTDIHFGNFLVYKEGLKVCVVDFGAVKEFSQQTLKNLRLFYDSLQTRSREKFRTATVSLGLIDGYNEIYQQRLFDFFQIQCQPWITNGVFSFTPEWFDKSVSVTLGDLLNWKLPAELVWFAKVCFGMNQMFVRMKVTGNFGTIFSGE